MQPQLFSTSLVFVDHRMLGKGCPKTHIGLLLGLNERLQPCDSLCFAVLLDLKVGQGFCTGSCNAEFDQARPAKGMYGRVCVLVPGWFKKVFGYFSVVFYLFRNTQTMV